MLWDLTEEQRAFQQLANQFAVEDMLPHASQWDKESHFPIETLKKAAQLGFASIYTRSLFGGTGLTRLDAALIFEELSTACPSTAAYLSIHNMVSWILDHYGDEKLQQTWLPRLATMDALSSYCLTEPNAGSDAASLKTTAVREGEYYVLNGTKVFISGGGASDLYICMVRTGEAGPKGITCVLVEKNTPGLTFGKHEEKLGWRSQPTTMVFFENCRVPITNRIGKEGEGFKIALSALNGGRINIAACSLGGARACLAAARRYVMDREQFGQKISEFQHTQFKLSDMLTELDAARLMVWRAAVALDRQQTEVPAYCAMAKRLATDVGFRICHEAMQLHGGYGYLADYAIERYFRDLRVHQILEGTNEIMRLIIAKRFLSQDFQL